LPDRGKFQLDVYGDLWDKGHVEHCCRSLGLQDQVRLYGHVADETLDAALGSAHLAINLRLPTMGEASESQLQLWSHALPSLVTRVGWYASLPEEAVCFVRPDHEMADIQAHLRAFLTNPSHFAAKGENGRQVLEEQHVPESYAEAVVQFVTEVRRYQARSIAFRLAE